jgi:hypothetical protein
LPFFVFELSQCPEQDEAAIHAGGGKVLGGK